MIFCDDCTSMLGVYTDVLFAEDLGENLDISNVNDRKVLRIEVASVADAIIATWTWSMKKQNVQTNAANFYDVSFALFPVNISTDWCAQAWNSTLQNVAAYRSAQVPIEI